MAPGSNGNLIWRRPAMNKQSNPRGRNFLSGLTAFAITAVIVSTLVEALNPALIAGGESAADREVIAAAHDRRRDGTLAG
jgi:hypothetical protein